MNNLNANNDPFQNNQQTIQMETAQDQNRKQKPRITVNENCVGKTEWKNMLVNTIAFQK